MGDVVDTTGKPVKTDSNIITGANDTPKPRETGKHRSPRLPNGLTAKQEGFAHSVAIELLSLSDAFRKHYSVQNYKPESIWTKAYEISQHVKVRSRIEELAAQKEWELLHDASKLRAWIVSRLQIEAEKASSDSARVAALQTLGKIDVVRLFKDIVESEVKDSKTIEAMRDELDARLAAIFKPVDKAG